MLPSVRQRTRSGYEAVNRLGFSDRFDD
jgi:hypothetical protein